MVMRMKNSEAVKWIKAIKDKYIHGGDESYDEKRKEALDLAIQALESQKLLKHIINNKSIEIVNPFNTYEYMRVVRCADLYDLTEVEE